MSMKYFSVPNLVLLSILKKDESNQSKEIVDNFTRWIRMSKIVPYHVVHSHSFGWSGFLFEEDWLKAKDWLENNDVDEVLL